MINDLVVTRHPGLVEVLKDFGLCDQTTKVIDHATIDDVKGKHVIGVLPLSLARYTRTLTEITLTLPPELRGKELTAEEVRLYMTGINVYTVNHVKSLL